MKKKNILFAILALIILLTNYSVEAESVYVHRNSKKHLVYNKNGVKQEAFYDYGTLVPFDDARIYSYCKGSKTNYVSIYYSDSGLSTFKRKKMTTNDDDAAYVNYTSGYDYLDA
ncbi:hypothetical protein, partial [Helcococcus ovis]